MVCLCVGNNLVSGKHLVTGLEDRTRKFYIAVNNVLINDIGLSEECLVETLVKQCTPIFMYIYDNWCLNVESKKRTSF